MVVGTGGCVVVVRRSRGTGLTTGFLGTNFVRDVSTAGISEPLGKLLYWAKNPSDVTLRSDTNWTSSTLLVETMGLDRRQVENKV